MPGRRIAHAGHRGHKLAHCVVLRITRNDLVTVVRLDKVLCIVTFPPLSESRV